MAFFILFALILFASYTSLRRELAPPRLVALVSTVGSIIALTLFLLLDDDATTTTAYRVIVGIIAGSLFSGLTLVIALYFHTSDAQAKRSAKEYWEQDLPTENQ